LDYLEEGRTRPRDGLEIPPERRVDDGGNERTLKCREFLRALTERLHCLGKRSESALLVQGWERDPYGKQPVGMDALATKAESLGAHLERFPEAIPAAQPTQVPRVGPLPINVKGRKLLRNTEAIELRWHNGERTFPGEKAAVDELPLVQAKEGPILGVGPSDRRAGEQPRPKL
jgi:hypothetical protein